MFVSLNDHCEFMSLHQQPEQNWGDLRQAFSHVQYSRGNYSHPSARILSQRSEASGSSLQILGMISWYLLVGFSGIW